MNIKRKYQQLKKITATILLATFFITSTSMPALAQDIYQKYQEQKKWRDILNADLSNNQADLPGAASGQAAGQESETTVPEAEMGIAVSDSYLAEQALQKYPATRFIVKYNDDYLEKLMAEEEAKSLSNEKKDIPNSKNNKNGKSGRRSFYASADRKTLRKVQDTIAASLENELNEEASVEMVDGYAILEIIEKKTALEVWKNIPTKDNVEYIQPDYEMEVSAIDNPLPSATPFGEGGKEGGDPDLSKQWGHYQLYHPEKQLPYRMDAAVTDAWLQSTGKGAIVAVLDTGIDINHPDLKASIWQNPNNNTDKGFAGDINGWDFFNNDNTVNDVEWKYDQWHSTHIAGIIAAQKDNGIGIAGVAPDAKIMPLKVFQGGTAYTSDIIAAIHYAEENGARIVNCSWGSRYENLALKEVIEASNMLFVCAAGNNGYNIDNYPVYPAAFDLGNVISVASINEDGRMSRFSNYGTISTDIAAPGNNIYSCWLDNGYNRLSGTSFAAAYVSGAAALLVGKNSDMTGAEMKARLLDSADTVIGLMDKVAGSKKLNCAYAVSGATVANTSVIDVADEAMPVRVPSYMAVADEDEYELYNAENYISYAQSLPHIRYGAIAIESNGKIYLCGGVARDFAGHSITANLLTYDHVSDTWTEGPEMDKSNYISPVAVAYNGKLYSFLGTSVGIYDPTINKWTDKLTIKGGASIPDLSAPSVVVDPINEKIYVVGGVLYINGRYVAQNTVYEYSIATNTLVALPNLSVSTGSASTIFYEGKIYFSTYFESYFGIEMAQYVYNIDTGSTMPAVNKLMDGICLASNDRAICIGQMFITGIGQTGIIKQFNLKTVDDPNAVYTSITHSFNEYRTDFATVIAYGKLYIIGGSDVSVEVMDLGWSEKAPLPVQLKDFRTIEMDGSIYVLGGTENVTGIDQVSKKVHAYDPQTNVWQPKADMPIYAKDFALAYSGYGKMYLIGGKTADSATGNFTDSSMIYEYDVDTNSWQTKGNLSLPRRNLAAVYMGNKIFAIGGENSGKTDFVEVYDPVGNTVTTQASLPIALSNIYATEFLGVIFVYDPDSGKVYKYDADNNQWQAVVPLGQAHGNLLTTISSNMYCLGYDSATSTTPIIYKYSLPDNTWGDYTTFNTYGNIKNIVSLNNSIYIFTALSGDYVTGMVTYTPPATPWFIKSSMPQSNGCMGTAALGDKIYVAGGLKSIGEYYGIVPDNALWEYDTVHDTWEMKASMNYARAHLGLVAANNKLYAIGGQGDNGCVPYVEEYDPEADTWTVKNTTGPAIHSMAVTNYNNNIYVFGGIESFYSDILNKAWKYDPIADNWTSLKTMPSMRCACAAAAIDGTIYIAGGLIAAGENGIEVYDIATNQWNTKESLSNTSIVYGIYPAMVAAKGKLYFAAYSVGMYGYPSMEPIFCEIDPVTGIVIDDLIGPPLNTISMGMVATDFGIYVLGGVEPSSYGLEGIFYGLISKCYKDVYFSPIEDAKPEYNDYIHMGKTEVNLSGNFSRTYTDMEVSVPGFNMKISRTYNSHDAREGTLGKSWTFGFEGTLEHVGNKIIARLPDGSGYTFYTNGSKIPWSQGSTDTKFVAADNRAILDKISDVTYILTTKDQYRYGFFDGYLTWMEDRNGNRININYYYTQDGQKLIGSVSDSSGRGFDIEYNKRSLGYIYEYRISAVTEKTTGRKATYEYIDTYVWGKVKYGILCQVTDPTGKITKYSHGSADFTISENEVVTEKAEYNYTYGSDVPQRVRKVTDIYGNMITYDYDIVLGKLTETDNNKRATTTWFDSMNYPIRTRDAEGNETRTEYLKYGGANMYGEPRMTVDKSSNTTYYDRDNRGNIIRQINPDRSVKEFAYDEKNNLIFEKDEEGNCKYYEYDANKINLVKLAIPLNGTDAYSASADQSKFAITEYQYGTKGTIKGLLMKETTPEGDANTYTYDNYGNIATKTNALGITTSYTYNAANWLTMVKDGNNQTTKFYYDKAGRLLKTVYNYSNVDETRERMIYDARGLLAQKISAKQYNYSNDTAFFDSQNIIFSGGAYNDNTVGYRYTYNAIGQLTSEKDPNNFATSYAYDIYNNKITETKPNGTIYSSEYDFLNRPTKNYYKANGSGSTPKQLLTEYSYNTIPGGESRTEMVYFSDSATDKAATTYIYDYAGRQTKQDNPDGSNQTVDYYANGQIKRSIDGRRFATYYTYDGLGNITDTWRQVNSSQYRYSGQEYDKAGRPLLEKYGKSLVPFYDLPADTEWVAYAYNADDTLAEKTTSAGGKVSYTYDNIGNILSETVAIDSEKSGTTKYTYDYAGRVLSKTQNVEAESIGESPDGLVGLITSYTYDLNGNVLTTTNAAGIKTGFTYDAMDRLLSTSMPGLDENNNATEIVTSATYDWTGNVLTATDAKGSVTTNTYTPRGWLMESKNALGGITHYEYDLDGRNTVQISAKNYIAGQNIANLSRTETAFDSMGRVDSISEKYQDGGSWKTIVSEQNTYDAAGNIIRRLDGMGNAVTYAYDGLNSLTSLTDAEGNTVRFEYDGLGHKVCEYNAKDVATEYVYDGAGNILLVSTAGQLMAANTYDLVGNVLTVTDALGATVTNTYDLLGQPRTSWVAGGENVETYQQNHWYDRLGRVIRQADSLGKCTMYTYNNQGQLLTSREEGVNGEIPISQSMRYDKNGNLCYATDPLGNTTEMTYDDLNRLSSVKVDVTNINGVTASQTTSYTYDANGNKLTEKDYLGNSKTYTYDPLNRLSEGYDELGNLVEKLEYNDNHLQIRSTDALGNATEFFYDKNNRQTATKDALGNTSYTGYDPCGNVASQTDPLGNITRYTYDDFNNLTQVRNALGETTGYTYDPAGNPLSQTDGKGNTLNFAYNTRGLLIRRIEADGIGDGGGIDPEKLTTYSYNGAGQLTRRLDRNGVESSSFYDLHGRLIKEITGDDTVTYSYDAAGNQLTMADSTGITTRAYDQLGRVISKTVPKIGASTYLYEDLSEITTDPLGNITGKKLDKAGRIAEVDGTNYTYYKNGNLQSVVYPGGAREDYTYYANNQLHTLSNSVAGSIIEAYNYAYDAAGNMTTKLDVKGQTNYKYDELNRLKEVTEPNGRNIKYVYDKAGNRLTEQVITGEEEELTEYTYDEQNRLLFTTKTADKTVTITNYSYDNNGNMLSELTEELIDDNGQEGALGLSILGGGGLEGAVLYEYDARNRLVRVITGENTIANTYNGEGRRIAKATNGNTHHYIYDYDKIVLETDDTGQEVAHNVYGLALVSRTVDGETLKYLYNGHGDVTALVSGSTVIGGYYYDAFGVIVEETGNANNPYRFSGYEYDTETMLYNLQARFYKAGIARFLQEDTYYGNWKDPLSLNLYTYCSNSPLKYWDPTGHKQETITIQLSDGTTTKGYLDNGKVYFPNDKGGRSAAVYGTKFYYNGGTYQYNNSGLKLIASDNKTGAPPPAAKPTTPPPAAQANIGTNKNTGNNSNSNSPGNLIDKGFNFVDKLINNGADKATAFIDKTSNKAKTEIRKATNNLDPNIASKINSFGDGFIDFFAGQATGYIEAQRDFTLDSVDQLRTPGGLVNVLTGNALATPAVNSFVKFAESSSAATADKPFLENMLTTALTGKGDFLAATHIEMAKGLIAGDYDRVAYAAGGGAAQALEIAAFVGIGELVGAVGGRAAVGESQIVVGETRVVAGESRAMIGEARTPTSRLPGATIDSATGREVGRFVVDPKGNIMIEPVGGSTVPAGKGGIDTHTLYPNGSNYQRLNPNGHTTNPTPHGHGHLQGFGPGMKGQGLSTDIFGNTVPWNSADAHWPISR